MNHAQIPAKKQTNTQIEVQDLLTNGPLIVDLGEIIVLKKEGETIAENDDEVSMLITVKENVSKP